jgi:hypothetical protein
VSPEYLSSYRQSVDFERGVLETSFDWEVADGRGQTSIVLFASQVDRDVLIFRFTDRVDSGQVKRRAVVETVVPYMHRLVREFGAEGMAIPADNASYLSNAQDSQWLNYRFSSDVVRTRLCWYGRASSRGQEPIQLGRATNGGMAFAWTCPQGSVTSVDVIYAIASDRQGDNPERRAATVAEGIATRALDNYQVKHSAAWSATWNASTLKLENGFWQKQAEIARYTLLINTGGSFPGNIAADEPAWDAHMLDTPLALNGLLEWGHVDAVEKAYRSMDALYRGAVHNAELIADYIGEDPADEAALLPTFLTHDGRVAIYAINHFMLHSQQNAAHALGLLRLSEFCGRDHALEQLAYRWLRAYANYALLISEWSDQLERPVFPLWKCGTLDEREWWPLQREMPPLERLDSIDVLFPEALRTKDVLCPTDVALAHRWVLRHAIELSRRLNLDPDLRQVWQKLADGIEVASNDKVILRHEKDVGDTRCMIAPEAWGLFYPCEDTHLDFPASKVRATLDSVAWRRNPHIPSWNGLIYAIAYAVSGDAERAWRLLQSLILLQDPRCIQAQDNVGWEGFVYYYFLNYGFFLTAMKKLLLQSQGHEIILFPAVPEALEKRLEFTNVPIGVGLRVSARLEGDLGEATFARVDGTTALKVRGRIRGWRVTQEEVDRGSGEVIEV